ncbi:adenylate/guanylate cyclase domain-containing protein [Legionella waltersii]|uniref:Fused adenylate cyclase/two component hybrid sensor/regulator n=1 Tax=Legionella waltersii TaxID=66969 RepID=A0A0W1A189_9GAMM|nr:adenylate/guanylate cyclase domain-containing protein [Legionella waltersii]KTD75098.1 fused adenylate cyclase/two component hybrid sensor/regulator [Legionella waltersii]SNV05125.1 adenylate cyclase [Legionella waltersii]
MKKKFTEEERLEQIEKQRLKALESLQIMDTQPEEGYERLVQLGIELLNMPICYIAFLDEKRQWFKSRYGLKAKQTPRGIAFCNETIKKSDPLIINDALEDSRFANSPLVQEAPFIRFYAGVPLTSPDGYNVGTFCLADTSPKELNPKELSLLLNLANIAKEQLTLRHSNRLLNKVKKQLELRNNLIRRVFSFYMSDDILNTILSSRAQHKLGGKESKITIMFTDLRNFTPLSESLPAEELVSLLNNYFTKMVAVIAKHKGTIDSFIGDAIMVIFGAPYSDDEDSLRAVNCALDMQHALRKLNQSNKKANLPQLEMGIGINTGTAVVGNIGSKKRMQYSAIGSSVNLSSRIQDLTLGGQILISEETYKEVANRIEINGHLRVKVKGIKEPITIYDVAKVIMPPKKS